jgi:peptidyl-prolyl cis-trans isomerase D
MQGYAVVRVNKVVAYEPPNEAVRRQHLNQYSQLWSGAETLAYFNDLKARFKAEILVAKPAPGADGASVQ